ncbi:MAG: ankyrin repeat domain-containing protein [Sedimentisphaerales bacterium]
MQKSTVAIFLFVILYQGILFAKADPNDNANSQIKLDAQLLDAVEKADPNDIKIALYAGANPNWVSDTPKRYSIIDRLLDTIYDKDKAPRCLRCLNLLFDAGAKLQWCDNDILFVPIAQDYPEVVELFIQKGASPTLKIEGKTPIEWAESYGHSSVVEVLIKHGAKPVPKRQALQSRFVQLARESYKKTEFGEQQNIIEMVKALEEGAYVDEADSAGKTALCEATPLDLEGYLTIVFLLQKGANPNLESAQEYKETAGIPLHHAIVWMSLNDRKDAHEEMRVYSRLAVEALLKAGANVSSRGYNGQTPLHIAAKYNGLEAAEMLIKEGSKIMDRDDSGKTPLDYAESAEMIKLLKSHGAEE